MPRLPADGNERQSRRASDSPNLPVQRLCNNGPGLGIRGWLQEVTWKKYLDRDRAV